MASSLPSSSGKIIPEYSTQQVAQWMDDQASGINTWTNVALIVVGLIGFVLFAWGVIVYTREARENMNSGNGGGSRAALTYMVIGGCFGAADLLFLMFVGLFRS